MGREPCVSNKPNIRIFGLIKGVRPKDKANLLGRRCFVARSFDVGGMQGEPTMGFFRAGSRGQLVANKANFGLLGLKMGVEQKNKANLPRKAGSRRLHPDRQRAGGVREEMGSQPPGPTRRFLGLTRPFRSID